MNRLRWWLRRRFWNGLALLKYKGQHPDVITMNNIDPDPVQMVPFTQKYPDIPISGPVVAARVPTDEAHPGKLLFTKLQHRLVTLYSPMQARLPPIDPDAEKALADAYTRPYRSLFPAPVRPRGRGLGELALASPYASYLHAIGPDTFRWDVRGLHDFECHAGLVPPGAVVDFSRAGDGGLEPARVVSDLGTALPEDQGWDEACRMAACSLTSHAALIRHFNWLHLTGGPRLETATRNSFSVAHPIRHLLRAHVFGTHSGNELVTRILMSDSGEFTSIFSFSHRGMCELFEATTGDFDLAAINPRLDAARRGLADAGLETVAQDNWVELYDIVLAHVTRFLQIYYPSETDIENDQEIGSWILALDCTLPNGVRSVLGEGTTMHGLASLLATFIYLATVEHEITGSGLWDYQLWNDTSPVRIAASGRSVSVDVYQRLVNANFNLNVHRSMLLDDSLVALAGDPRGAQAIQEFQQDLLGLQSRLDQLPPAPWRMEPRRLKANINA